MLVNYSDQPVGKGIPSVFLAGPTPRDKGVQSWRPEAINFFRKFDFEGLIYTPEREQRVENFDYNTQVEWEQEALYFADKILFWIPRDIKNKMPAFITNSEFSQWLHYPKGYEEGFLAAIRCVAKFQGKTEEKIIEEISSMPEFEKIKWLKEKVLYGRPDWADKNRYLDDRYKKLTGRTPINSLEELVRQTVMRIYNPTIL